MTPRTTTRFLQITTAILLASAVGIVAVSAAPAIARELGWTEVRVVRRESARGVPQGRVGADALRSYEEDSRRMPFEIQDLDDRRDPHRAPDSRRDIEEPEDQPRVAVAVRDVTLREEPDSAATEVARVDRGTQLYVMKLEGDWVLVVHQGRGGLEVGWARSREVAIR